ncbi:MAG: hypothetical protein H7831_12605 [Magnetococcus sp. WYHC-3]
MKINMLADQDGRWRLWWRRNDPGNACRVGKNDTTLRHPCCGEGQGSIEVKWR